MLICFYGDHTHAHTCTHFVSHVLAPSHTWSERDQARPNWIGLNSDERATSLAFIFLIVCLRYSGMLNPRFLLLGPFSRFFSFHVLSLGSENWTSGTGLDLTGLYGGLMDEGTD